MQYYMFVPTILKEYAPHFDPGVKNWMDIWNISHTLCVVDRSGVGDITMPYPVKLYEPTRLPIGLTGFDMTYEQCCEQRATQLIEHSRKLNKPISILYSGGVDSTLVVVSFLKALSKYELRDRIQIVLNYDSIAENPHFFEKHIRRDCTFISSARLFNLINKESIIVSGECNDQLHGTAAVSFLEKNKPGSLSETQKPYSRESVIKLFKLLRVEDERSINRWYDLMEISAKRAPCEIKTTFQLLWWLNFVYKWQDVYFRTLLRANKYLQHHIDYELLENYYFHFYDTIAFQKWAMLNPHLKVKDTWNTYKFHAKELIYKFDGNEDYLINKKKYGSLATVFVQRKYSPVAIGDDFSRHDTIEFESLYNRDHFFRI